MIFGLPADVIIILSGLGANSVRVLVHLSGRQIAVLVFSRRSRFQATLKYVPSLASMLQPHAVSSENAHAATCLVGVDANQTTLLFVIMRLIIRVSAKQCTTQVVNRPNPPCGIVGSGPDPQNGSGSVSNCECHRCSQYRMTLFYTTTHPSGGLRGGAGGATAPPSWLNS